MRSAMHLGATTKVRSLSEKDQRIGCGQGPLYAHSCLSDQIRATTVYQSCISLDRSFCHFVIQEDKHFHRSPVFLLKNQYILRARLLSWCIFLYRVL